MIRANILILTACLCLGAFGQSLCQKVDPVSITSIVNNEFANKPFGERLTMMNLNRAIDVKLSLTKKVHRNDHTSEVDTLYTYCYSSSTITFYKGRRKSFFYGAVVLNEGIKLRGGVGIGMSRSDFLDSIGASPDIKSEAIAITDSDDYTHHKFWFVNNRLTRIELNMGID